LSLSLDEAVRRALENNVDIAVQRYNPEADLLSVRQAEGYYEPSLTSTLSQSSASASPINVFAGGQNVTTKSRIWNFGGTHPLPTGGAFSLTFNNSRGTTNDPTTSFDPLFQSGLTASLSQPLWRNFRIDPARQQIRVAKKNYEISDFQFRQTVINTLAGVKETYYDLIYAIDNLEAARKSRSLAARLLEENDIRVRVGTMAPLDVVSARAELASREEGVILAESQVADAEDALKQAIYPANDPAAWATRIVPSDRPTAEPLTVSAQAAIDKALSQRTDVQVARRNLEIADYQIGYVRNQFGPAIDAFASYGVAGAGGNRFIRDDPFGPVVRTEPGGYGDALSDVFGRDFPTWRIGVQFSYPILNRQGKAARAQAQVYKDQTEASIRRLELAVAAEVRAAARAVETNFKRVESTRAARDLAAQRLDAETKRFGAGMSTNYVVTQTQRDLAVAEVAELRAIADYRKSLIQFERVQEAGLGGGGGIVTVSTTGGR
jgi:outer membrane protein TolC